MTTEQRDAFYGRGYELRRAGRSDLAAREFERALGVDPGHARSFAMLALCRGDVGDHPRAVDAAQTALTLDPSDAFVHRTMGWAFVGAGRPTQALPHAMETLKLAPRSVESFVLLGEIHLLCAQWEEALSAADQALALNPNEASAHRQRSAALRNLKRPGEARAAADAALSLEPNSYWSHLILARAAGVQRDMETAARSYREALRIWPVSTAARQGLLWAMKTRNPLYRGATAFHRWFYGLHSVVRTGITLLAVVATGGLGSLVLFPVLFAGRIADPVANFVLRFDRYGRQLLTAEQILAADKAMSVILGLAGLILPVLFGVRNATPLATGYAGAIVPVVASAWNCRPGRATLWMSAYVTLDLACAAGACVAWVVAFSVHLPTDGHEAPVVAGVWLSALAVAGLLAGRRMAKRCGYPWSHHFESPSR